MSSLIRLGLVIGDTKYVHGLEESIYQYKQDKQEAQYEQDKQEVQHKQNKKYNTNKVDTDDDIKIYDISLLNSIISNIDLAKDRHSLLEELLLYVEDELYKLDELEK